MKKPYIVSSDIRILLSVWAKKNGFTLPPDSFFDVLRRDFSLYMKEIFSCFELVSEDELVNGMTSLIKQGGLPVVSLDKVYTNAKFNLEIARLVDLQGSDCGLGRRTGALPILKQIRLIQENKLREVAVADDVIFTGEFLERVINLLARAGIRVPLVYAGIGISDGVDRINGTRREVRSVRKYHEVIDEVCERDFYPGVPLSGRLLLGESNTGVPYLLPFGRPDNWASIPSKYVADFSQFCVQQTIRLFIEIEKSSHRPIFCSDMDRQIPGIAGSSRRFIEELLRSTL